MWPETRRFHQQSCALCNLQGLMPSLEKPTELKDLKGVICQAQLERYTHKHGGQKTLGFSLLICLNGLDFQGLQR